MYQGSKDISFSSFCASSVAFRLCVTVLVLVVASQVFGQKRSGKFQDEFLNTSKLNTAANVVIDTTGQGDISLVSNDVALTTESNFRFVLSGMDTTFVLPRSKTVNQIYDIDRVPGEQEVYLVTEFFGRQVYTYNGATGMVIIDNFANDLITPVDADPFMENGVLKVLITDNDGRVIKVNSANLAVEWDFRNTLLSPSDAVFLASGDSVLICDSGNNRIIEVAIPPGGNGTIVWDYGDASIFSNPVDVEVVPGDTAIVYLVTDERNHRVVLVQRNSKQIIWQFGIKGQSGNTDSTLTMPSDADALPNGNILICDRGNNRLIEVNRQGQIVYRFAHDLFELRDADRIPTGIHSDKTIIAAKMATTETRTLPRRLSYFSQRFVSKALDFGRRVDFDSLRWRGLIPTGTNIRLQLRTVSVLSDTSSAEWFGPTGTTDFYTATADTINPIHDGDRYVQFLAYLDTQDRLETPVLNFVQFSSHFFRIDPAGSVESIVIRDSADFTITNWNTLEFGSRLALQPGTFITVDLLDDTTGARLQSYSAGSGEGNRFPIDEGSVPALQGRQSLRLRATLRTENQSVTPFLLSWSVSWDGVMKGPSNISFTNNSFTPVDRYKISNSPNDKAYLTLTDPNVLPIKDQVFVDVFSEMVADSEKVKLEIDPTRTAFINLDGVPLVFAQQPVKGNGILEVTDRDTLRVFYFDSTTIAGGTRDSSMAKALIIQKTSGRIVFEDRLGSSIADSVSIGDTLFVRVSGERDQSLSPTLPDSIMALVFTRGFSDLDSIPLFEIADANGAYHTGEFVSRQGIRLVSGGSIQDDRKLTVGGGDPVRARYDDPDDGERTEYAVTVRQSGGDIILTGSQPFSIIIAPNPYVAGQHNELKLKAQVRTGEMLIQSTEVFNLAGDRVSTIPEGFIDFGSGPVLSSMRNAVEVSNWWNLQTNTGDPVASGTYFVKFIVRLMNQSQGATQNSNAIQKLVIVQ